MTRRRRDTSDQTSGVSLHTIIRTTVDRWDWLRLERTVRNNVFYDQTHTLPRHACPSVVSWIPWDYPDVAIYNIKLAGICQS